MAVTGDIFSYLPQSLWIYSQLIPESAGYEVRDRVAFIGVNSAPQIRRSNKNFYINDYNGFPRDVLFLGDEESSIESKINSATTSYRGDKARSTECVVYSLLRELDYYTGKKDSIVTETLANCRSSNPRYRHDFCKAMLKTYVLRLKDELHV